MLKKFKSILIPIVGVIGMALASEFWGFKKQFKVENKNNEDDEKMLKMGLFKKGIFKTIMVFRVVSTTSEYILKDMENR